MDVRTVTPQDIDLICRHREEIFREAGRDPAAISAMTPAFRVWLRRHLEAGSYFGFILVDGDTPVAGIGLMELDWAPHPIHPDEARRGYILNVYVEKSHRRQGLGVELMQLADTAFRERGIAVSTLHATQQGRPVYQSVGWEDGNEMTKVL